ncbi:hypothetical protein MUY35_15955 [Aliiroseovarius sp. S1339]|uniref:DUF7946 domain-containing protein n=1 Tax=Aliiroseovarius sp. S1339 TaxID=2936990 RepID=UPI0020BECD51|nr:hypothetical protein [Aliiroseovarius sp. S1339]MCK8465354.1 hypothetical protein [Aliiroseovarius sp. S1339]
MEKVFLKFDGREASQGRLHYYEYTRSQYATARFISTVEHFRRTQKVAQRITRSVAVEILVETPKEGSFLEVLFIKAQETAASAIAAPLGPLISFVWSTILPRSEKTDSDLIEMARIQLATEKERTKQGFQESERMNALQNIIESQSATTLQALTLLQNTLPENAAYGRANLDSSRLSEINSEMQQEHENQKLLLPHKAAFQNIDSDALAQLTSRIRPMVPEMALPLKKSANTLSIGGDNESKPYVLLNPTNVAEITEKSLDDEVTELEIHVRSYDRDRGIGKVTSPELKRQLNFAVPPAKQFALLENILESMAVDKALLECRTYRDKSGEISSLLLVDISPIYGR